MSEKEMLGFMEKIETDDAVRAKFEQVIGGADDKVVATIEFGKAQGWEISQEDVAAVKAALQSAAAEGELDDDALEGVAGGGQIRSAYKRAVKRGKSFWKWLY